MPYIVTDINPENYDNDKATLKEMVDYYIRMIEYKQLQGLWIYKHNLMFPVFRELDDAREYGEFMKSNVGMIYEIKEMEVTIKWLLNLFN